MSKDSAQIIPLVIGGAASGVGKTTVAIGLMGAFRRRGLSVAPFKTGPDYIDPSYHHAVTGVTSRNLDTWLTSGQVVKDIYARGSAGADVAVIEGAMGLFDGRAGGRDQCSTAEIALLTGGAVVLVVDCARQARSLAPVLAGFAAFDRRLKLAGAILNNVGSPSHARVLEDAAREAGVPVLGVLPRHADISLKSRHLGLVPAGEGETFREVLERIIDHVAANVDVDGLLALTQGRDLSVSGTSATPSGGGEHQASGANPATAIRIGVNAVGRMKIRARLAVAMDAAFSFYYMDSLEALEAAGAELVYFSPLRDAELPACEGLYLGGGYPEMFADELEANTSMRTSVAAAIRNGLPAYAECGGLVYLCREVEINGERRRMAGALPLAARMAGYRQALGYVEARARRDNLLLSAGGRVRGHEFHWSAIDWQDDHLAYDCFSRRTAAGSPDGFCAGNLLTTYVHIHFAGNLTAAARFIDACSGINEVTPRATA